jgi:hypothetical protein
LLPGSDHQQHQLPAAVRRQLSIFSRCQQKQRPALDQRRLVTSGVQHTHTSGLNDLHVSDQQLGMSGQRNLGPASIHHPVQHAKQYLSTSGRHQGGISGQQCLPGTSGQVNRLVPADQQHLDTAGQRQRRTSGRKILNKVTAQQAPLGSAASGLPNGGHPGTSGQKSHHNMSAVPSRLNSQSSTSGQVQPGASVLKPPKTQGRKIRWGTIIPLIGGSALGCHAATGSLPLFHLSYPPFQGNEVHIRHGGGTQL